MARLTDTQLVFDETEVVEAARELALAFAEKAGPR
jgi:hypothetical protein